MFYLYNFDVAANIRRGLLLLNRAYLFARTTRYRKVCLHCLQELVLMMYIQKLLYLWLFSFINLTNYSQGEKLIITL